MELSVVVPTLNGRERLSACLDALATRVPEAEVVVANGPSTDGTTGMVCERDDVDVLLELPERNVNVARNAGIEAASGDVVAVLGDGYRPEPGWRDAVETALDGGGVATGPTDGGPSDRPERKGVECTDLAGRSVSYFDGGNVAFARETVASIDGFDEYLQTGGARDAAHRLAALGRSVEWAPGMCVRWDVETDGGSLIRSDLPRPDATDEEVGSDWGWKYRSLTYRLAKNYGVRPTVARRVLGHVLGDAGDGVGRVLDDDATVSTLLSRGRTVGRNVVRGYADGFLARFSDRSPQRNPNGISARADRPVERYEWR